MENPGVQSSRPETLLALVVARLCLGPGPSRLAGDSWDGWLVAGELRHWKLPSSGPATILITFITINVHGYAFFITSRYHVLAFHELLN